MQMLPRKNDQENEVNAHVELQGALREISTLVQNMKEASVSAYNDLHHSDAITKPDVEGLKHQLKEMQTLLVLLAEETLKGKSEHHRERQPEDHHSSDSRNSGNVFSKDDMPAWLLNDEVDRDEFAARWEPPLWISLKVAMRREVNTAFSTVPMIYCTKFGEEPKREIVGHLSLGGFCQRLPTLYQFIRTSGSDKSGISPRLHEATETVDPFHGGHAYEILYPFLLENFRGQKELTVLELGTHTARSSLMWTAYFGKYMRYVGIDNQHPLWYLWVEQRGKDPNWEPTTEAMKQFNEKYNFHLLLGPQSDHKILDQALSDYGKPDIIIDDAAHVMEEITRSFVYLFPRMASGGIYIVEDLNTAYSAKHSNSWTNRTKRFIDVVNRRNFDVKYTTFAKDDAVDHLISSIHCAEEICAYVRV